MNGKRRVMIVGLAVLAGVAASPAEAQIGARGVEGDAVREVTRARLAGLEPMLQEVSAWLAPVEAAEAWPAMEPVQAMVAPGAVRAARPPRPLLPRDPSRALRGFDGSVQAPAFSTEPPPGHLQEDPGGALYQSAREALNRRRYQEAARQFAELRTRHPQSGYVADSYYWQAFALFRAGGARELRDAAALLSEQASEHPDASTRRDADALRVRIEAQLAQRGDADAAASIAQQAAGPCDEGQEVRLAALSALLNMNEEQAVPILQEVLRSRDQCSVELRRRAVFLIAQKMDEESVDILLDLAHRNPDPDPEVREQAVFWLHQVDSPEALDALESILLESDDPELQERAIFAISQRSGDTRAIEALRSYAERTDIPTDLRADAIFWISQSPDAGGAEYLIDLYPRLDDPELKERTIFGVSQVGSPRARTWLLERVRDATESVEIRKNALFWAGQIGGVEMNDLLGLYDSLDDPEMREQVIFVASQDGGTPAIDFLMEVAENETDPELRKKAMFWLGQSNDPRVTEFLLRVIRG